MPLTAAFGFNSSSLLIWHVSNHQPLTFRLPLAGKAHRFRGPAVPDPRVNFGGLELPKTTHLVRGHLLPLDPLIDRVGVDPQVHGNLFDRQPAFVHILLGLAGKADPHQLTGQVVLPAQYRQNKSNLERSHLKQRRAGMVFWVAPMRPRESRVCRCPFPTAPAFAFSGGEALFCR